MFVVLTVCLVLGHTGRFERSGSCVYGVREAPRGGKKKAARKRAALELFGIDLGADYGAYVIVRTPATLPIVIVVPCEKPAGYTSFATEFSTLT
jgi:hypothetical protein